MERVGVVDIGSNTVRLVVYDVDSQLPVPMFNERVACRLGAGLHETGRLNPDGTEQALTSIDRFVRLSRAMSVDALSLVATAAVRDAEDGHAFVAAIKDRCGIDVEILSGEEEARLAAVGVMHGIPDADGIVCDLGGGSLDLVHVENGECARQFSLPFGHLRLHEVSGGNVRKARKIVAAEIEAIDWGGKVTGRSIYGVGGSIRALARLQIEQSSYPLHIVDNFTVFRGEAKQLTGLVSKLSTTTLKRIPSIPSKRIDTLPMAAVVLDVLLDHVKPKQVVFSAFGMREGRMIRSIPRTKRAVDPLIAGCRGVVVRDGRSTISGEELDEWMRPLFADDSGAEARSRLAACLLSDIGWHEHPDYRAEHAFLRVLRLPLAGMTHQERVIVAASVYIRYGGSIGDGLLKDVMTLASEEARNVAGITGLALQLGHRLAGSAPGLLAMTAIAIEEGVLSLEFRENAPMFGGESVERRVRNLAQALQLDYRIGG